jgi:hypothetical protein
MSVQAVMAPGLQAPAEQASAPARARTWGSSGWLLLCLAVPAAAVFFGYAYFLPWIDEGQFVDPGASWHFGQGFTSSAWPYQRPDELFFGNAPGFPALLGVWFDLFGFGLLQARALVWLQALVAAGLLWVGMRRQAPGMHPLFTAFALAMCFCGWGVTLSLWSARYDLQGLLLAAAAFAVWTGAAGSLQRPAAFLLGAAVFLSGFHLVVAAVLAAAVVLFVLGRSAWPRLAWGAAGLAACALLWMLGLALDGQLKKFIYLTFGSQHTLSGQLAQLVVQGDPGVMGKVRNGWRFVLQDPSWTLVCALLAGVLALGWRAWAPQRRQVLGWVLGLVLFVPLGLLVVGKFPPYYIWIGYFPAVLLAAWLADRLPGRLRPAGIAASVLVFALAAAIGVGQRLGEARSTLAAGDYGRFAAWAGHVPVAGDLVFSDFEAYFAARAAAGRVFTPTYGQTRLVPGIPEAGRITLLLVQRRNLDKYLALMGPGPWKVVSRHEGAKDPRLDYVALRRDDTRTAAACAAGMRC